MWRRLTALQHIHTNMSQAPYIYPLMENAYAHALGRTADEHLPYAADLFARFSVVAAAHPLHSWYAEEKTKEYLLRVSKENRIMGYPYRKWMCARDEVDQSACLIMMSWAEAERRGIHADKLVFLHGSGDAFDATILALRHSLEDCRSMQDAYTEAFRSAGLGEAEEGKVALFDMYSCFPIAVEMACDCVGMDPSTADVSRMTQTGGLAYHGGPGSNYSSHGICAVVEKLRLDTFRGKYGVVGANGGWLTEHSVGVYSTAPPAATFARRDYKEHVYPLGRADACAHCQRPMHRACRVHRVRRVLTSVTAVRSLALGAGTRVTTSFRCPCTRTPRAGKRTRPPPCKPTFVHTRPPPRTPARPLAHLRAHHPPTCPPAHLCAAIVPCRCLATNGGHATVHRVLLRTYGRATHGPAAGAREARKIKGKHPSGMTCFLGVSYVHAVLHCMQGVPWC